MFYVVHNLGSLIFHDFFDHVLFCSYNVIVQPFQLRGTFVKILIFYLLQI